MYNFCIHDTGSDKASMFLWPETIAGRGSSEIASCILQYFKTTPLTAKRLLVFSDNCSGQNKNFNIMSLWQYLIEAGNFEEITHIYPVSGHTMMPCDRDFGDIERKLRKKKCIYAPSEYVDIIKDARVKNKFKVTEMTADKFMNMEQIATMLTKRNVTTDKVKIDFRQVFQFRFTRDKPLHVHVKLSHNENEPWKIISFQKRGRPTKLHEVQLVPLYNGPRPITKAKADDVKSLLPFVPPIYHEFYNNIVVDIDKKGKSADAVELMDECEEC